VIVLTWLLSTGCVTAPEPGPYILADDQNSQADTDNDSAFINSTVQGYCLQKGIEWLNPSNTLAAQTYMILFIILFIQFRPKGIVAPKGRAAAD
jgi:hypothetical protein